MARIFGFWRSAPRSAKWVMGVSLALNLFIVGVIAGGAASGRWGHHGPHRGEYGGPMIGGPGRGPEHGPRGDPIRATLRQLPDARRDALEAILQPDHHSRHAAQRRICAAGGALADLWTGETPPDPGVFAEKTQALHEAWSAAGTLRMGAAARFYQALTPEERASAAQFFRQTARRAMRRCGPPRWRRRRRHNE